MGLRMNNFDIMGFTEKSDFQEGGSHENSIYTRKLPKRGGGA